MEAPSLLGQGHVARIAVEQPNADPRLEPGDGSAHARRRETQDLGRTGEIPRLGDGRHDADAG
jgi:hypothetical protein